MAKTNKIIIVGVGHIGGSLGLSLMESKKDKWHVIGIEENGEHRQVAMKKKLVHEIHPVSDFSKYCADADIVVICVNLSILPNVVLSCSEALLASQRVKKRSTAPIVTDVGSVKTPLLTEFGGGLASHVPFVGGHPVAGTEHSGPQSARANLFQDHLVILTPVKKTETKAVSRVRSLWESVGAKVEEMTPSEHDQAMAAVSHLPHMLAYGLMETVSNLGKPTSKRKARNLFQYAAGGLNDFTRIANSNPTMWRDIAIENQAPLVEAISEFKKLLSRLEESIARGDGPSLEEVFRHVHGIKKAM